MHPLRPLLRTALAAGALALAAAPGAHAAGGLKVAPSYVDVQVRAGTRLGPLRLTNSTNRRLALSTAFFSATEDVSGLPVYETSARERAAGARLVRVSPARMTLAPGQSGELTLSVVRRPRGAVAAYGVVVALARPLGGRTPSHGAVAVPRLRISANLLLHFPGAKRARAAIENVSASGAADGRAPEIVARLVGTGNTDVLRGGRAAIIDAKGRTRMRVRLPAVRVLPGARRNTVAAIPPGLGPGRYTARVSIAGAPPKSARFRLIAGGRLARAALRLTRLTAHRDGGSRVRVSASVRNVGTEAGSGTVELVLVGKDGQHLKSRRLRVDAIAVGGSKTVEVQFEPKGESGAQVQASLRSDGFRLDRRQAAVATPAGTSASIEDWLAAHVRLLLVAFVAIMLATVALCLAWVRRTRMGAR